MKHLQTFITLALGMAFPCLATTYTSASYVQQEHLIVQWDGIDNAGTGTHDPNATVWRDLKGGYDLTLKTGGSWNAAGNALVVDGYSAEHNGAAPACKTIEVVFKMTRSDGLVLFWGGNQTTRQLVVFANAGTNCYCEGFRNVNHRLATGNFATGTRRSVSATFSTPGQIADAMYSDGALQISGTLQNSWLNETQKIMVGIYPSMKYAWYGEVYSIRMYDCELTAREIAANHAIDEARFGEPPPEPPSYASTSYVQDGLVAQWDGIDNAGTGTHNPNATVWKDLAGNLDMTLTANGSWTNGNALAVNGCAASGSTITPAYKTIEIVYSKPFQERSCVFFHSGMASRYFLFRYVAKEAPSNWVHFAASTSTKYFSKAPHADEITCAAALYDDNDNVIDIACDGERRNDGTYTEGWGVRDRVSVGGRPSSENYPAQGKVYAIRLYSRRLSKAELARNNMIDRKRFMTSASYVQDGLIAQWDGEDNVGVGYHVPGTLIWKDLKGDLDLFLTSRGGWNAAGNALTYYQASAYGDSPAPPYRTIELAYRSTYQNPPIEGGGGHNSVLVSASNAEGRQMVFFRDFGQDAYFSGIKSADTGVKHVGVNIGTFNSNAVHVLAATYTNVAAQTALTYLDGSQNTRASVDDVWSVNESRMIIGDNKLATYRPAYGELYALRFYDRELTAEELAADAAIDQKRIFAPRVMTWKNLVDGNFCTGGNWTVSGTGGQNIPRYSDRVFLPDGDYVVMLDEDWAIGELSVGAGATLKISLPEDGNGTYGVVPLTVENGVTADVAAKLDLDVVSFNKAHYQESATLITCGTTSTAALQTLADSFNTAAGKTLVTVESGNRLIYTAPPPSGTMMIFR